MNILGGWRTSLFRGCVAEPGDQTGGFTFCVWLFTYRGYKVASWIPKKCDYILSSFNQQSTEIAATATLWRLQSEDSAEASVLLPSCCYGG